MALDLELFDQTVVFVIDATCVLSSFLQLGFAHASVMTKPAGYV